MRKIKKIQRKITQKNPMARILSIFFSILILLLASTQETCFALFGKIKPPTGVKASLYDDSVVVTWVSPYGYDARYRIRIERGQPGGPFTERALQQSGTRSFPDTTTGLPCGVDFVYRVRIIRHDGKESIPVLSNIFSIPKPPYLPVTDVQAVVIKPDRGIGISWKAPHNAGTRVTIERTENEKQWRVVGSVPEEDEYYQDADVANGLDYTYRVVVCADKNGAASDYSVPVTVRYAIERMFPPSEVNAMLAGNTALLTWKSDTTKKNEQPLQGLVERRVNNGVFETLATVSSDAHLYRDTRIETGNIECYREGKYVYKGNTYQYRIRFEGNEFYAPSLWVETKPVQYAKRHYKMIPFTVSSHPETLALIIEWQKIYPDRNPQLRIERRSLDTAFELVDTVSEESGSYVDHSIKKGVTYQYRITVLSDTSAEESDPSLSPEVRYISPAYPLPDAITAVAGRDKKGQYVRLSWTIPSDLEEGMPQVVIERSVNSRDFEHCATVPMSADGYTDYDATAAGGVIRPFKGHEVRMNVYRYRLCSRSENGEKQPSEWLETRDVVVMSEPG